MEVKLVSITQGAGTMEGYSAEDIISYCARVSNPNNQLNFNTSAKLLKYCIDHKHWSIFEMVSMTVEITTSRGIAAQILRHGANFQEASQRYASVDTFETYEARRQDKRNRQNSIDDMFQDDKDWFQEAQETVWNTSYALYEEALARGLAKEQARFLLPLNTTTKMYMNNTCRNWIHYLQVRCEDSTQKEHRDIANAIKVIFCEQFPNVSEALVWK